METNNSKGKLGEQIAKQFLEEQSYKILDQNFRGKHGEIDLIVLDYINKELVFVEVKTRTNISFGYPIESIDYNKMKHIISTTQLYIYKNRYENMNIRFDVIEVYLVKEGTKINHIKGII